LEYEFNTIFTFLELNDVNSIVHDTYEFKSKNTQKENSLNQCPYQNLNSKNQFHATTIDLISEYEGTRNKNMIISVEKNSLLQANYKKVEEEPITSKEFFLNNLTEKIKEIDIREYFLKLLNSSTISSIRIFKNSKNRYFGFINFENFQNICKTHVIKGTLIKVEIAKTKSKIDTKRYQKSGSVNKTPIAINIFINYNNNTRKKKYKSLRFKPYS
jgi:hypothetical protein